MKENEFITLHADSKLVDLKDQTDWIGPFAFLMRGEKLPECQTCQKTLSPILQLKLSRLSSFFDSPNVDSYLQLFYCVNEDCEEFNAMDDVTAENFLVRISSKLELAPVHGPIEFETRKILLGEVAIDDAEDPVADDKIGGFPAWVQTEAHAHCRLCRNGRNMQYRIQFSSIGTAGFPFPEGSAIFISQCKLHRDQLGMIWQCS